MASGKTRRVVELDTYSAIGHLEHDNSWYTNGENVAVSSGASSVTWKNGIAIMSVSITLSAAKAAWSTLFTITNSLFQPSVTQIVYADGNAIYINNAAGDYKVVTSNAMEAGTYKMTLVFVV